MKCRNCGSESVFFRRFYDDARWGKRLAYHKCLHCLVEFHESIPNPLEWYTSGEYRRTAGVSDERSEHITGGRCRRQIKWIDARYPDWRSEVDTILDVGAFQGVAVAELRSQGFDATGYEPDPHEAEHSEHVTSDISDIGNVDLLWMSHVLEHTGAIDMLRKFKGFASQAFVEIPPGNYQLPHILVFRMDAVLRTAELADMRVKMIDNSIKAILEW